MTIPNSVTTIESDAFNGCYSLTNVTIPNSVTTIESAAFSNCLKLVDVYCYATTPPSLATFIVSGSATLHIPQDTKTQYQSSAWGTVFKNIVEME